MRDKKQEIKEIINKLNNNNYRIKNVIEYLIIVKKILKYKYKNFLKMTNNVLSNLIKTVKSNLVT